MVRVLTKFIKQYASKTLQLSDFELHRLRPGELRLCPGVQHDGFDGFATEVRRTSENCAGRIIRTNPHQFIPYA
jgi:hypothetical protein